MDTAQTEKLKALALAAGSEKWHQDGNAEDVVWGDDGDSVCYCQSNIGAMPEPVFAEHRAAFIAASCPATVLDLIADNERLRARFEYIEDHATTNGGGHGFTITCFVPVDCEDIGCGIDAAIEKEKA